MKVDTLKANIHAGIDTLNVDVVCGASEYSVPGESELCWTVSSISPVPSCGVATELPISAQARAWFETLPSIRTTTTTTSAEVETIDGVVSAEQGRSSLEEALGETTADQPRTTMSSDSDGSSAAASLGKRKRQDSLLSNSSALPSDRLRDTNRDGGNESTSTTPRRSTHPSTLSPPSSLISTRRKTKPRQRPKPKPEPEPLNSATSLAAPLAADRQQHMRIPQSHRTNSLPRENQTTALRQYMSKVWPGNWEGRMRKYRKGYRIGDVNGDGGGEGSGAGGNVDLKPWGTRHAKLIKDLADMSLRLFPDYNGRGPSASCRRGLGTDPEVLTFAQDLFRSRRFAWLEDAFENTRMSEGMPKLVGEALFVTTLTLEQEKLDEDGDGVESGKYQAINIGLGIEIEEFASQRLQVSSSSSAAPAASGLGRRQLVIAPTSAGDHATCSWPPNETFLVESKVHFKAVKGEMWLNRAGFLQDSPASLLPSSSGLGGDEHWEERWPLELSLPNSSDESMRIQVYDVPMLWDDRRGMQKVLGDILTACSNNPVNLQRDHKKSAFAKLKKDTLSELMRGIQKKLPVLIFEDEHWQARFMLEEEHWNKSGVPKEWKDCSGVVMAPRGLQWVREVGRYPEPITCEQADWRIRFGPDCMTGARFQAEVPNQYPGNDLTETMRDKHLGALQSMGQLPPKSFELSISTAGSPYIMPPTVCGNVFTLVNGLLLVAVENKLNTAAEGAWQMMTFGPGNSLIIPSDVRTCLYSLSDTHVLRSPWRHPILLETSLKMCHRTFDPEQRNELEALYNRSAKFFSAEVHQKGRDEIRYHLDMTRRFLSRTGEDSVKGK